MKPSIEIKLVTIDLSFHRAASAVVQTILMRYDITVHETFAPREQAFELLKSRDEPRNTGARAVRPAFRFRVFLVAVQDLAVSGIF